MLMVSSTAVAEIELGINYSYKKSTFDVSNNTEQQSLTGSISFYLWQHIALEFSYTNGLFMKKEKQPKPSVKVEDLSPEADPKGGSLNFAKIEVAYKETLLNKAALKIGSAGTTTITDSTFKLHK